MSQFQGSVHSSALFLTAAAQNLLCLKLATEMGVVISSPWVTWVKGALAPALVGMLVTPLLMYKVSPYFLSSSCMKDDFFSTCWVLVFLLSYPQGPFDLDMLIPPLLIFLKAVFICV